MSSGGTPSQTTTTTRNEPPAWAIPHYQGLLGTAANIAQRPYTPYTGERLAGLNGAQVTAQQMVTDRALSPSTTDSGQTFAQGLLGGAGAYRSQANPFEGASTSVGTNAYAGSNPYLDKMIYSASKDVTDAYTKSTLPSMLSQFNAGGAFGGTAMADALAASQEKLAGQLGDLSNQFRFQDYTTQQGLAENALNRSVQAQQTDFQRNASLADARLNRDYNAWDSYLGRQTQSLALLPGLDQAGYYGAHQLAGVGDSNQSFYQQMLDSQYGDWLEARDWQGNQLGLLGNALNSINGGFQNQQSTAPNLNRPNPTAGALGGAATGASMGSAAGPWGTAIGAVAGGLLGYFGNR